MITMINYNSEDSIKKYNFLFRKAWQELNNNGLKDVDQQAADEGKEAFSNLAHYFGYLKDLIAINPIYLMMPIDEEPLNIDANSRTIKIPDNFSQCSGVQSDNYAEIVTFIVDRYFDYKDLTTANVAVQWRNETSKAEGVSFIDLFDLETYGEDNKIRFGWPLTAEMTSAAGNLTFAVRFFTSDQDATGKTSFNYLLNTTTATLPIKPSLDFDFNDDNIIKKATDYSLFKEFVTNSSNPSYDIPTPVVFVESPDTTASIGSDDSLTLTAQAITANLNPILYTWYRQASVDGYELYQPESWPATKPEKQHFYKKSGEDYVIFTGEWPESQVNDLYIISPIVALSSVANKFTINNGSYSEYNPDNWPTERPLMTFWEVKDGKHVVFSDAWPKEKPATTLYVRKSTLTFEKDGGQDILGRYFVEGVNENAVNSVSTRAPQSGCVIRGPKDIEIIDNTDLQEQKFLSDKAEENHLSITITPDAQSIKTYTLYKDGTKLGNAITTKDNVVDFEIKDYGQYYITASASLNRSTTPTITSKTCNILGLPIQLICDMYADGVKIEPTKITNNITEIEAIGFDNILLQIIPNNVTENPHNVGTVTYKWSRGKSDSQITEEITGPSASIAGDIVSLDKDKNGDTLPGALLIRAINPDPAGTNQAANTYYCTVSNEINGKIVESAEYAFVIK